MSIFRRSREAPVRPGSFEANAGLVRGLQHNFMLGLLDRGLTKQEIEAGDLVAAAMKDGLIPAVAADMAWRGPDYAKQVFFKGAIPATALEVSVTLPFTYTEAGTGGKSAVRELTTHVGVSFEAGDLARESGGAFEVIRPTDKAEASALLAKALEPFMSEGQP